MNHLMIDIETVDTRPTAAIVSVAFLLFDPTSREQKEVYSANLDLGEQLMLGRTASLDTLTWWLQQDIAARRKAFAPESVIDSRYTQDTMRSIIQDSNIEHIWANDPDFDCTILRDFMGYDFKWPFWKHRSMRTIKAEHPDKYGIEYPYPFIAHDPMGDCKKQAWHVMNCWGGV
jgi:hypothetical protein